MTISASCTPATYSTSTVSVTPGGNGTYTVANVQALTGVTSGGLSAGWSLIVVYEDETQPLRNLTVFAGFVTIATVGNSRGIRDSADRRHHGSNRRGSARR